MRGVVIAGTRVPELGAADLVKGDLNNQSCAWTPTYARQ
jgi:hypothetical protein